MELLAGIKRRRSQETIYVNIKTALPLAFVLVLSFLPKVTAADHKKNGAQRGMLEKTALSEKL
jgi:hypothetical protein